MAASPHSQSVYQWKRNNPVSALLSKMVANARQRSRESGLPCTITTQFLRSLGVPSHCPLLGIPLDWSCNAGLGSASRSVSDASPSLDRLDNSLGYIPGNVWIISMRANRIKSNADELTLFRIAKALSLAKMHAACP